MSELILTDQSFETEVKNFSGVTLVDFWAEWCGPCRIQGPIIDELAAEFSGNDQIKIAKLNVDDNQATAQAHSVMSIPTLILFKNGQIVETIVGVHQKNVLQEKINKALEN